jgi:AraC-like DNA-binding protein
MEKDFIQNLTDIIEANINDPKLGADELARKMSMSYVSLRRKLRSLNGKSINQFIREIRLKRAWEFLQDHSVTAAEVAFRTGFSSAAYFNTCFSRHFGYPPGEARGREESEKREEREDVRALGNRRGQDVGARGTVPGMYINHDNKDNHDNIVKNVKHLKRIRRWAFAGIAVLLVAGGMLALLTSSGWLREE